jgi:hypothetical protein
MVLLGTEPFNTAWYRASPKNWLLGISWSRPARAAPMVEVAPPQSDNTQPLKLRPEGLFRWPRVTLFSQEWVPFTRLYEHMMLPMPASTAPQ